MKDNFRNHEFLSQSGQFYGQNNNTKSIFKSKSTARMANASDQSIDGTESSRFRQLSMKDSEQEETGESSNRNIFLSLSLLLTERLGTTCQQLQLCF